MKYKEVLDKVKLWLEDEIEANKQFGHDPTNTAKDLLKNSSAVFGNNFETSFSKYKNKNKSARASLLMLSDGALVNLLRTDPALAANFAAALVVTRFK